MKKTSISQMYVFTMICHIFTLICGISGSILMIVFNKDLINTTGEIFGLIFIIGIVVAFIFLIIFSLKVIIILLKDFKAYKYKNYISITGKVIAFKRNREPESGMQINDKPIIKILNTNEEIVLNINDKILVGETYNFNYLQYSKIAEIE